MHAHDTEVLSDVQPSGNDDLPEKGNMHRNHTQSRPAWSLLQFLIWNLNDGTDNLRGCSIGFGGFFVS